MKHLKNFKIFENEMSIEEAGSQDETMTGWLYNFFSNLSSKFKAFSQFYHDNSYRDSFGKPIDSGLGWLIGTTGSIASEVAAKVFKPSDVFKRNGKGILGSLSTPTKGSEVTAEHQRLLNKDFIDNDLSSIKSEQDLTNWSAKKYAQNGLKPGDEPFFDQMIKNNASSWKNGGKVVAGEVEALAAGAGGRAAAGLVGAEAAGTAAAVGGAEVAAVSGAAVAAETGMGIESLALLLL
jgi:hypothetical protein